MIEVGGQYADFAAVVHRGFAFLLVNGLGWLAWGVLARWWPPRRINLLLLIQGAWSFPLALALQNATATGPLPTPQPPLQLLLLLAFTQMVAIPASLIAFIRYPTQMPSAFAAVLGGHFLPYAWIYGTNIYVGLGILVSLVPFAVMLVFKDRGYPLSLLSVGVFLLSASWMLY